MERIIDEIFSIVSLRHLTLGDKLTEIPESVGNLTNLTELDLDANQLPNLPESIGNLTNLTGLGLRKNQLTKLPESIGNLRKFEYIGLEDNPITNEERTRLTKIFGNNVYF